MKIQFGVRYEASNVCSEPRPNLHVSELRSSGAGSDNKPLLPSLVFLPPTPTGYYAGYVASAFTFGRFLSGYALGHVTDAVGRKPIIVSGLFSIMVLSVAFALSPTFGFAVGSRCVKGFIRFLDAVLVFDFGLLCCIVSSSCFVLGCRIFVMCHPSTSGIGSNVVCS